MLDIDFKKALDYGKEAELKAAELFEYDDISFCNLSEYDGYWIIDGKQVFFEVKRCRYLDKTGNICIELSSNEKLSGISITKADYYLYFNDDMSEAYLIDVLFIKRCIARKLYHRSINCGYNGLSRVLLFDKNIFAEYRVLDGTGEPQ